MSSREELEKFERTLTQAEIKRFELGRDRFLDGDAKFQKWDALRQAAINEEMKPATEAEINNAWAFAAARATARICRRRARRARNNH